MLDEIEIFKDNKDSLKNTSADNSGKPIVYMTEQTETAVNFDKVKEQEIRGLGLRDTPSSVDALYERQDHTLCFIEFKNGVLDNRTDWYKIKEKIYNSMSIFLSYSGKDLNFCRHNMDFILVYNKQKNSKYAIADKVSGLGKQSFTRGGLEYFEKYYFRNVYTYDAEEFEKYMEASQL